MIQVRVTEQTNSLQAMRNILAKIPAAIEAATEDAAKTMKALVEGRTPTGDPATDPHSGQAKDAWTEVQQASGGFAFENPVDYGTILEEGLYDTVGPRTVAVGDKIFSRQAPGGIMAPLLEDDKVLNQVASLVAEKLLEALRL